MRALYYHRVVTQRCPGDVYDISAITAAELDAHAAELARHWRVLSLAELSDHLASGRRLPSRAVHISFDDGYRDNLMAAEIFEARHLPWTLFVVSDAALDGFVPWYVRLAGALRATPVGVLAPLGGAAMFKSTVKRQVMAASAGRHLDVLEEALRAGGILEPAESPWPFLSAAELRDLAGRGVEIGNHSATHPNLARCGVAELDREVAGSQTRLQDALGRPVRSFAYPDGRHTPAVVAAVGQTHELAMATWTPAKPLSPLRMRRFPVGPTVDDLQSVLAGGYPARYRAKQAKWALRRRVRALRGSAVKGHGVRSNR